jgi:hypothetical protein
MTFRAGQSWHSGGQVAAVECHLQSAPGSNHSYSDSSKLNIERVAPENGSSGIGRIDQENR